MKTRPLLPILTLSLLLIGCDASEPDGDADARCPLQVTQHVTEPTVWDCDEVHVQIDLFVQDHLTIMPYTEVVMSEGTYILVRDDGKLTADGQHPDSDFAPTILFRGEERRKNYWGGITIQTISDDNIFVQVEIADTGATGVQGSNRWALGILGGGTRGLLYSHEIKISNAGGIGLSLSQGAEIGWGPTSFEDVDDVIVRATFDTAHQVGQFDDLIRVERPWIRVENGTLDEEVGWSASLPYRIVETPRIEDNGLLRILPSVVVEFAQDVWLGSGSGRLKISGNADFPVLLTGVEKIPGYWGGVTFQSVSEDNVIENAVIEYAGGRNFNNHTSAVYVNGGGAAGSVSVENATIRESADIGIWIREGGFADLTNVTFENNAGQNIVDDNP